MAVSTNVLSLPTSSARRLPKRIVSPAPTSKSTVGVLSVPPPEIVSVRPSPSVPSAHVPLPAKVMLAIEASPEARPG